MYQNNFSFNPSIESLLSSISCQLSNLRSNGSTFESENVKFLSTLDKISRNLDDIQYRPTV